MLRLLGGGTAGRELLELGATLGGALRRADVSEVANECGMPKAVEDGHPMEADVGGDHEQRREGDEQRPAAVAWLFHSKFVKARQHAAPEEELHGPESDELSSFPERPADQEGQGLLDNGIRYVTEEAGLVEHPDGNRDLQHKRNQLKDFLREGPVHHLEPHDLPPGLVAHRLPEGAHPGQFSNTPDVPLRLDVAIWEVFYEIVANEDV